MRSLAEPLDVVHVAARVDGLAVLLVAKAPHRVEALEAEAHAVDVLVAALAEGVRGVLGEANVKARPPIMGGEDFGRLGKAGVPICLYFIGTIEPERYAESQKPNGPVLPSTHADSFAPVPAASIRVGVRTMSAAVLDLMGKPAP